MPAADSRASAIEQALAASFDLAHLEVHNESHQHSVPADSETHFKLVLVTDEFAGTARVQRHRAVNRVLQSHFDAGLHALSLHLFTLAEWRDRHGDVPLSPPCLGGSAGERRA